MFRDGINMNASKSFHFKNTFQKNQLIKLLSVRQQQPRVVKRDASFFRARVIQLGAAKIFATGKA
jgi:hypothetical protein